jgi:ribonuclease P/MRP protein subunit RPP25
LAFVQERKMDTIILKALGQAINKTVAVAEIVKRRVLGLQQNTGISSVEIVDTWEPIEEGLNTIETPRQVSMVTITLSRNQLDPSSPGYQPPVGDDEIKDFQPPPEASRGGRRGRGRSRGRSTGRGNRNAGRGRSSAKNANTAAA